MLKAGWILASSRAHSTCPTCGDPVETAIGQATGQRVAFDRPIDVIGTKTEGRQVFELVAVSGLHRKRCGKGRQ